MKVAFYPGSFNPWHEGHQDVLRKTLKVFDKVVIMQLSSDKTEGKKMMSTFLTPEEATGRIEILHRTNMSIVQAIGNYILGEDLKADHRYAVVRGLRNEKDFCDEQMLQYWYEDLGILMTIFYVISDRKLVHISSSAIRAANKFTEK